MNIAWEKHAQEIFAQMIERTPVFVRDIAKTKVSQRAELLVQKENRSEVSEKDVIDAFFHETPGGFHGLLKSDFEAIGVDYTKYGYEKDEWKNIMGAEKYKDKEL